MSTRHLLKPCSGGMKHVFAGAALEAVLAAAKRPPSNEDSSTDRSPLLGGLRRSFVTRPAPPAKSGPNSQVVPREARLLGAREALLRRAPSLRSTAVLIAVGLGSSV